MAMERELVLELDGERLERYEVIIGCSLGAESAVGCDGEWISGYVVADRWLLAPDGGRLAVKEFNAAPSRTDLPGGFAQTQRAQRVGGLEEERGDWRVWALLVGLVVLWVGAVVGVVAAAWAAKGGG